MKQLTVFLIALLITVNTYAQNARAQLLFEEAEALYNELDNSNEDEFGKKADQISIKINEVTTIVGEKPKVLFLAALTANKVFKKCEHILYDKVLGEHVFSYLNAARSSAKKYLEMKGNNEVDDRYREMNKIVDGLQKYPADKQAWQKEKQRIETEKLVRIEDEKRRSEELDSYYHEIAPKIDAWEWNEGIKIGGNFEELKKQYPELYKNLKKHPFLKNSYVSKVSKTGTLVSLGLDYLDKNKISNYSVDIYISQSEGFNEKKKETQIEMEKLKQKFRTIFGDSLVFEKENDVFFTITSPYANYKIEVNNDYFSLKLTKSKK